MIEMAERVSKNNRAGALPTLCKVALEPVAVGNRIEWCRMNDVFLTE